MGIAFQHRKAVVEWAHATSQHIVSVVEKVMYCNGRRDVLMLAFHKLNRVVGRDVFKNHLEIGNFSQIGPKVLE